MHAALLSSQMMAPLFPSLDRLSLHVRPSPVDSWKVQTRAHTSTKRYKYKEAAGPKSLRPSEHGSATYSRGPVRSPPQPRILRLRRGDAPEHSPELRRMRQRASSIFLRKYDCYCQHMLFANTRRPRIANAVLGRPHGPGGQRSTSS